MISPFRWFHNPESAVILQELPTRIQFIPGFAVPALGAKERDRNNGNRAGQGGGTRGIRIGKGRQKQVLGNESRYDNLLLKEPITTG